MQRQMNAGTLKKPTNVSINSELLAQARELKINLSATLEQALINEVRERQRAQWREANKEAIEACNVFAEKNGLFADKYRVF